METLIAEGIQRLESSGENGLEQLCARHPQRAAQLRQRIARLREQGLLTRPALLEIGPYRLLRSLGRGGMGEVFLAEQRHPVRRLVAVKVVREDVVDASALVRFEAERQALALMDHPGIARVFEAGATADGRPYLAMEYVDGVTITAYCDQNRLSLAERLDLFADVCDAVHHAHQNGVIHRDLKPNNVLVRELDGRPRPKIIDFGLAKAFGGALTAKTLLTHAGQVLGTPAYMSPEQAAGDGRAVDTRADVYALGAMLYELTCGSRPFDERRLQQAGLLEVLRILREEEPPTPTKRLVALTASDVDDAARKRRLSSSASLLRELHGEIDWIVRKAISKAPKDRYPSVSEFGADVRRHLAGQAVVAGPPTAGYRVRKFVRRHRGAVSIGSLAAIAAVVALTVIVRLGIEARTNLLHFDRLAGRAQVRELLRQADESLWPAHPATIPAMEVWLARARGLGERTLLRELDGEIEQLSSRQADLAPNQTVLLDGLRALRGDLVRLAGEGGAIQSIETRMTEAQSIGKRTVEDHRDAWDLVIASVKQEMGLELQPIVGLVPLGRDPTNGLCEFQVVTPGGSTPQRDAQGHLVLAKPEDDPVLVLLPGGDVVVGSQSSDPSAPNYDPDHATDETPAQRCRLEPFLISEFEITQAQWRRVMGSNPSTFAPNLQAGLLVGVRSELHPVESVSWIECLAFCQRLGIELPSEAQWEYAARSGNDAPWWTGRDPALLEGAANLLDTTRKEHYELTGDCLPWRDHFAAHAPVGSFRRNGFGLADVTGNVWEWTRNAATGWPPTAADRGAAQSFCGGSFASDAKGARITHVLAESAVNRKHLLGFRPSLVPSR